MKLLVLKMLLLSMFVLASPFVDGAPPLAESDRSTACATGQSQVRMPHTDESLDNLQIILAGVGREQCWGNCNSDLRSCVGGCPGFDENNVVDPKYAHRKCKAACDTALSQCKSSCPAD